MTEIILKSSQKPVASDTLIDVFLKLFSNPVSTILYLLVMIQFTMIVIGSNADPFLLIFDIVSDILKTDIPKFLQVILFSVQKFISFILKNRRAFIILILFIIPNFIKFSLPKLLLSLIIGTMLVFASTLPLVLIVILAHLWIFYLLSSSDKSKFLVVVIFLLAATATFFLRDDIKIFDEASVTITPVELKRIDQTISTFKTNFKF